MAMIFRKLSQKRHWDGTQWLEPHETQADAAKCLMTSENRLSIFVLDAPDDQTERVIAALAVTRDNMAHLALAIVLADILARCGIQRDSAQGQTPDSEVNDWHENLIELTVEKIARLAAAIKSEGKIMRYNMKKMGVAIQQSLDANYIGTERINGSMVQSLRKRGIIR